MPIATVATPSPGSPPGPRAVTPAARRAGNLPSAAHDASSPEWDKIASRLFPGSRTLRGRARGAGDPLPLRSAYGASVPVKVVSKLAQKPELYVRRLFIVVDKEPSPVAAVLDLTTEVGRPISRPACASTSTATCAWSASFPTASCTPTRRYVKTSGGCSAPPNRDSRT